MMDEALTLDEIGTSIGVTRERVRQIEDKALRNCDTQVEKRNLKVKEIEHLLDEYQVESVASKMDDGRIRVIYLTQSIDEKMNDADKSVLQNPFILKGTAEELDAEAPAKIKEWVSKLKEGKDNLVQIQEELDKAAKAKKTPAKKTTAKKAAPRKTAAQKKAEARAKQAEEMEGQGDLFESSNRLEEKKEDKQPLKTAVEKATEQPSLEDEVAELGI